MTDLRTGLPGAGPDVLTQRLRELQESGVVHRRKRAPPAGSWIYELTEWGAELEPLVTQPGRWAGRSPGLRGDADIGVDSLVLSLRALFDERAAQGLRSDIALKLGEDAFAVRIADGAITLSRGEVHDPDATLTADPRTFAALLRGQRPLPEALRAGAATIDGPRELVERFLELFPLPEPATTAQA